LSFLNPPIKIPSSSALWPPESIIDYTIINDRLKSNIEDKRVFRGKEIDSDHKLVGSKFKFLTRAKHSYNKMDKTIYKKPQHLRYICWNKNQ
jgi:hypothetical protein